MAEDSEESTATGGRSLLAPITDRSYLVKMGAGGLLIVAVVVGIGLFTLNSTGEVLSEDASEQFQNNAELQSQQARGWFGDMNRQTRQLAQRQALRSGTDVRPALADVVESSDSIIGAHYVELTGESARVLESTSETLRGSDADGSQLAWASLTMADLPRDQAAASTVYDSPVEIPGPSVSPAEMAFLRPVGDDRAVVVVTNLGVGSSRLRPPTREGRSMVVRDGTIVLSTNPREIGTEVTQAGYVTSDALTQFLGSTSATISGGGSTVSTEDQRYQGTRQVTGAGKIQYPGDREILVLSQAPRSAVFGVQNQIQQSVILLAGVVLGLFVLVFGTLGYTTVRDLRSLSSKAEQVADGDFDVPLETGRGDEVGQAFESVDRMRDTLQQRIQEAERAAKLARQAQQEQRELNNELTDAVKQYAEAMDQAADGHLGVRLDDDTEVEQLNLLARRFNDMLGDLRSSIEQTKRFSDEVTRASEDARVVMDDISEASGDIARAMQSISDAATDQNQQLEGTLDEVNDLAATTEELASTADQVAQSADRTAETCRAEIESAQEVVDNMQAVNEQSRRTADRVDALQERMDEIDEISDFIQDVAKQTNMLALNANIEASRASGDGGDEAGFEVVADEITDLADQIQNSAGEIDDLIKETVDETDETVDSVERTRDLVTESTQRVNETIQALEQITGFAQETNTGVQQINQATQAQAASTQEVTAMVEDANDVSERTASDAESVAAAAQEQTASVDEIDDDIRSLTEQARSLDDSLSQFTLDPDAAGGGSSAAATDD